MGPQTPRPGSLTSSSSAHMKTRLLVSVSRHNVPTVGERDRRLSSIVNLNRHKPLRRSYERLLRVIPLRFLRTVQPRLVED